MAWTAAAHPRAAAGSGAGGQFISYDASKNKGTGYGKKGGDVRVTRLQKALNALGFTDLKNRKLEVDGMLGPLTTSSVKKAQRNLGLKPDGKVTPDLLNRLEDVADAKRKGGASAVADAWIRRSAARKTATKKPSVVTTTTAPQSKSSAKPGTVPAQPAASVKASGTATSKGR